MYKGALQRLFSIYDGPMEIAEYIWLNIWGIR